MNPSLLLRLFIYVLRFAISTIFYCIIQCHWVYSHGCANITLTIPKTFLNKHCTHSTITPHFPLLVLRLLKEDRWQGVWGLGLWWVLELCLFYGMIDDLSLSTSSITTCHFLKIPRKPSPVVGQLERSQIAAGKKGYGPILSILQPSQYVFLRVSARPLWKAHIFCHPVWKTDLHLEDF